LAIEANRVKDKIMRLVAHDLKKPFVGIIQLIEVLKSNELISKDPEISNLLKMILDKSNSQIEMIGDLLNTDRIKLGGRFIKPEKFNISKLVNSTYNEFIELFENKRIQFKNLIPSELEIFADKNLVREVFKNLISNSIKFSYRGTRIQVSSKEEKHGYSFIFEDQGIGIEPDKLKEILSNNEVIDSEKGTEGEFGTGIGLNLIINIMKFHSGDIKIETEVNNGTKIILFFPG
ncbi:MAG: HAMP domain-containing histidine kinase, partial [Leptospiraceae bacterium]|nr:HAMP domain-containing histidine kinase [Leptospiraceae bacterium]